MIKVGLSLCLCALFGCGAVGESRDSGVPDGGGTGGGAVAGGAGGGSSAGGGTSDAGRLDSGVRDAGPIPVRFRQAAVDVVQAQFGGTDVSAYFLEALPSEPRCIDTMVAGCLVNDCYPLGGLIPGEYVNAGILRVTGFANDAGLTLRPNSGFSYIDSFSTRALVRGRPLRFETTGDVVPAFSAELQPPEEIQVTAPPCPMTLCGNFSQSGGVTVTWTGGGSATVVLAVSDASPLGLSVSCPFPASAGRGSIPPAALARIGRGFVFFSFYTETKAAVQAGPFPVTVRVLDATRGQGMLGL